MAKIVRFYEVGGPEVLKIEDILSMRPPKAKSVCVCGQLGYSVRKRCA